MRYLAKTLAILLSSAICIYLVWSLTNPDSQAIKPGDLPATAEFDERDGTGAYYAAAFDGTSLWAAGSGGKLTRISTDNKLEQISYPTWSDLYDLCWANGILLACGKNGTIIFRSDDGTFRPAATGTTSDLLSVTEFKGSYYAAGEDGILLTSPDGRKWFLYQLPVSSDVIGLEANDELLFAITRESDYLVSKDGVTWKSRNYNKEYKDSVDQCVFESLKNLGDSFFVVGQLLEKPDIPFIMFTEDGQVWLNKPLARINGIDFSELGPLKIYDIDCYLDQLIAACDSGRLLNVTSCAECNQLGRYAEHDLYDLAIGSEYILLVGDEYTCKVIALEDIRQYKIQPEQALADYLNHGAVLIDVRNDEEWATGHIEGAVHIPLTDLSSRLPQEIPDKNTQLIFYCSSGKRSQTALEEAKDLGYQQVYNLGGIEEWPYELE